MNPRIPIAIDPVHGEARIGEVVLPVAEAGSHGELRVGGPEGPILRPLTFGERTRIVSRALATSDPRESVCAGILRAATLSPGVFDGHAFLEVMALILAGAACPEAPAFADALLLVARSAGWTPDQLAEAEAAEVDRLAVYLGGRPHRSSWKRLVFLSTPEDSLEAVRAELADDLLARAEVGPERGEDFEPSAAWECGQESLSPSGDFPGDRRIPLAFPLIREGEGGTFPGGPLAFTTVDTPESTLLVEERGTSSGDPLAITTVDMPDSDPLVEERGASPGNPPAPPASFSYRFPRKDFPPDFASPSPTHLPEPPTSPQRGLKRRGLERLKEGIPIGTNTARLPEKRMGTGGAEPQRGENTQVHGVCLQTAQQGIEPLDVLAYSTQPSSSAGLDERANPLSGMGEEPFGIAEALAMLLHEEADLRGLDR
ncbi:MAG TPA: hypothetical protein VNJ09_09000 [Chthonomonadales bacterium]|nr:hypothetical protein [Chthonomonadales bacterium]